VAVKLWKENQNEARYFLDAIIIRNVHLPPGINQQKHHVLIAEQSFLWKRPAKNMVISWPALQKGADISLSCKNKRLMRKTSGTEV
jgi:hypothetical protein